MKKRKIISLISSILCSIAIVGLFCLSSFVDDRKQNKTEVSAMNESTLRNVTCTFTNNPPINTDFNYVKSVFDSYDYTYELGLGSGFTGYDHGKFLIYEISTFVKPGNYEPDTYFYIYYWYESLEMRYADTVVAYSSFIKIGVLKTLDEVTYNESNYPTFSERNIFVYGFGSNSEDNFAGVILGDINFINGDDIANTDMLLVFNYLCTFKGYNSFSDDYITQEQYLTIIGQITEQYNEVLSLNEDLRQQVQNAYDSGYNTAKDYYEEQYNNNMYAQYQLGYQNGYNAGSNVDETVTSVFNGILTVGMVPINFFLAIFNFEILGINLSYFIKALFTVLLVLIVVKIVIGSTGGGK